MHSYSNSLAATLSAVEETPLPARHHLSRAIGDRTSLVIVSPFDEHLVSLLEILSHTNWDIYSWANCAGAMSMLRGNKVAVVLCDRNLPDGRWQSLLAEVNSQGGQTRFIVTAHLADERLWAEALNLGAYDVLEKPFDATEVIRVVSSAYCSWRAKRAERKLNAQLS